MTDILERLDIATMRLASESQDEATIRRNQTIADAKTHIAAQDARIEALEGALRKLALFHSSGGHEGDWDEIEQIAKAALGGEQHGG